MFCAGTSMISESNSIFQNRSQNFKIHVSNPRHDRFPTNQFLAQIKTHKTQLKYNNFTK